MAMAGGVGAAITAQPDLSPHAFMFGEDQGRYVVTCAAGDEAALIATAAGAGVPLTRIGQTGGAALTLPHETPISVGELANAFEAFLPAMMAAPGEGI
jgi:phosphoribosylformylglycinamidine (FGAM) synthase-like enzyme